MLPINIPLLFIIAICSIIIGSYVLFKDIKNKINIFFFLKCLSLSLLILFASLTNFTKDINYFKFYLKFYLYFLIIYFSLYLQFYFIFTKIIKKKIIKALFYLISLFVILLIFSANKITVYAVLKDNYWDFLFNYGLFWQV